MSLIIPLRGDYIERSSVAEHWKLVVSSEFHLTLSRAHKKQRDILPEKGETGSALEKQVSRPRAALLTLTCAIDKNLLRARRTRTGRESCINYPTSSSSTTINRPLSRRLDRCDRVIQDEVGDSNGGNV